MTTVRLLRPSGVREKDQEHCYNGSTGFVATILCPLVLSESGDAIETKHANATALGLPGRLREEGHARLIGTRSRCRCCFDAKLAGDLFHLLF